MRARDLLFIQGMGERRETKEADMEINWQRDIDAALEEANQAHRPLLLDFSAAPM
jgi:hypothetical protein